MVAISLSSALMVLSGEPSNRSCWLGRRKPWHGIQESVLRTQEHWVECLRHGREPDTSGADNLKTFALCEAAYASAAERADRPTPGTWRERDGSLPTTARPS